MKRESDGDDSRSKEDDSGSLLCASCDRCRARKTRCNGERPCLNCINKYLKAHKLSSIDGIDPAEIECVFSPAKKRGPVPGRANQHQPTGSNMFESDQDVTMGGMDSVSMQQQMLLGRGGYDDAAMRQLMLQQQAMGGLSNAFGGVGVDNSMLVPSAGFLDTNGGPSQLGQLNYLQQIGKVSMTGMDSDTYVSQGRARRVKTEFTSEDTANAPDTVTAHMPLISRDSIDGNRLRAFYRLSVDELYVLPPIPSVTDYCARHNISQDHLPDAQKYALKASRFAEIAIGAVVHNEIALGMELCNATVHCLRECMKDPVQKEYAFEVARAYFLLGAFRAYRGDMVRYFKYRRASMTQLSKASSYEGSEHLLSAIAFLDAWAYMIYNANEKKLPNIDDTIPKISCPPSERGRTEAEVEIGGCCRTPAIVSDPKNQMWIQGAPPVYLNNEAHLHSRSLDAIACAIRSCCDQANTRFAMMSQGAENESVIVSPTSAAVLANENELCSRNMILSAAVLLQQHEASTATTTHHNQGHHMILSVMDAFLEDGDEDGTGGFTDGQVQALLSVCNTAVENPLLLYHGGPTYHMVSNAAILLCHLMNGLHAIDASVSNGTSREMEAAVFEEILDTFLSIRKLLNIHRRKLPVMLRCHAIPRPSLSGPIEGQPFVDLGETLMCGCRGCQGFVLMACSPCVAAERARNAEAKKEAEYTLETDAMFEGNDVDRALFDLENEFDLDDDALLSMLSSIAAS